MAAQPLGVLTEFATAALLVWCRGRRGRGQGPHGGRWTSGLGGLWVACGVWPPAPVMRHGCCQRLLTWRALHRCICPVVYRFLPASFTTQLANKLCVWPAGLILENWVQGRHKHLWLSVGADLKIDTNRDLADVGGEQAGLLFLVPIASNAYVPSQQARWQVAWQAGLLAVASVSSCRCNIRAGCPPLPPPAAGHLPLHALNKLPYGKLAGAKIGVKDGVMFLTYSSLTSSSGAVLVEPQVQRPLSQAVPDRLGEGWL